MRWKSCEGGTSKSTNHPRVLLRGSPATAPGAADAALMVTIASRQLFASQEGEDDGLQLRTSGSLQKSRSTS